MTRKILQAAAGVALLAAAPAEADTSPPKPSTSLNETLFELQVAASLLRHRDEYEELQRQIDAQQQQADIDRLRSQIHDLDRQLQERQSEIQSLSRHTWPP